MSAVLLARQVLSRSREREGAVMNPAILGLHSLFFRKCSDFMADGCRGMASADRHAVKRLEQLFRMLQQQT